MLGVGLALAPQYCAEMPIPLPPGFDWDGIRFPLLITKGGTGYRCNLTPRDLVDPGIWTGPAFHVDVTNGDDANSGLGAVDGDFSAAKRSIYAAFTAGNATLAPYRVIVKPGHYEESAFTRNGNDEPDQPVAVLGWDGPVQYRTGPHSVSWANSGVTFSTAVSSAKRVFRTDLLTAQNLYTELTQAADLSSCQSTHSSWFDDNGILHVNIGQEPSSSDIAVIRNFHGARFLTHSDDLYLENIHCEGGITGALHCDAVADRNIVAVDCSFRYSAPSNVNNPLDAVQIRRSNGLAAFFNCDASAGATDGWSFHEDGNPGLHVLMQGCSGFGNGAFAATSCNGFTSHDAVLSIDLDGDYGYSRNGTEVHCIQTTHSWFLGSQATARDVDGSSVAFKCSNSAAMWLQDTAADAAGAAANFAIEANGGGVFTRDHNTVAGDVGTSNGGVVAGY